LLAAGIQEHTGPGGRVVFPELPKIFFEEIGSDAIAVAVDGKIVWVKGFWLLIHIEGETDDV
jgi:hypothetical protein